MANRKYFYYVKAKNYTASLRHKPTPIDSERGLANFTATRTELGRTLEDLGKKMAFLKALLQSANTWMRLDEHKEAHDGIHITDWGLGYRAACHDFYMRLDVEENGL